jgi:hypothetical protein
MSAKFGSRRFAVAQTKRSRTSLYSTEKVTKQAVRMTGPAVNQSVSSRSPRAHDVSKDGSAPHLGQHKY